jgi:vacuolar-type H+-ATPase subunit H
MSDHELDALERNVTQARARFADDLARLRSPNNLAGFKDDVWTEARETKDELVDKIKAAAKDGARRVLTELKERAAANPLAAAAVAAGLAWRLVHRPPIATLLIGAGLFGLLRTSAPQRSDEPYMGLYDEEATLRQKTGDGDLAQRAADTAGALKDKVQDWSASAGETARTTARQVAEKVTPMTQGASQMLHDARATARETLSHATETAASLAERASTRLQGTLPDREDRDKYLLSAAALAVAAAVGIAYQRRTHGPAS